MKTPMVFGPQGIPTGPNLRGFGGITQRPVNAPIRPPSVTMPNRGDYGTPTSAPTINDPTRGSYGTPDRAGVDDAANAASGALHDFNDPTHSGAFTNLMSLANEQTGQQFGERQRAASDAASRRGYAGGFEGTERAAASDRMSALAQAGFAGAAQVRGEAGDQYGRAEQAFVGLQNQYSQAKSAGDIAYAHDLTSTHIQNAQNFLETAGLNQQQQLGFAKDLTDARNLQAQLSEAYNKDLIDNARFVDAQRQISAGIYAKMAGLQEQAREFDVTSGERSREFDTTTGMQEQTQDRALAASGRDASGRPYGELNQPDDFKSAFRNLTPR